jgi:hypothetical protein
MSDLVRRLSEGRHPVMASVKPEQTVRTLNACLDRGYVHIRFTGTRGGTELGVPLDRAQSDFTAADFERETGRLRLVGALSLDYVRVRCVAEIELPSLEGYGWLEPVAE